MKYYKISRDNEIVYLKPKRVPKEILEHYENYPDIFNDWEIPILKNDKCYRFISGKMDLMVVFRGYIITRDIYGTSLQYILELLRVLDDGINIFIPSDALDRVVYSKLGMRSSYDPAAGKTFFYFNMDANPISVIKSYKNLKEVKSDLSENVGPLTKIVET
jgi:hypothetical protein